MSTKIAMSRNAFSRPLIAPERTGQRACGVSLVGVTLALMPENGAKGARAKRLHALGERSEQSGIFWFRKPTTLRPYPGKECASV